MFKYRWGENSIKEAIEDSGKETGQNKVFEEAGDKAVQGVHVKPSFQQEEQISLIIVRKRGKHQVGVHYIQS